MLECEAHSRVRHFSLGDCVEAVNQLGRRITPGRVPHKCNYAALKLKRNAECVMKSSRSGRAKVLQSCPGEIKLRMAATRS